MQPAADGLEISLGKFPSSVKSAMSNLLRKEQIVQGHKGSTWSVFTDDTLPTGW